MPPKKITPAEWLDLLAARAEGLRKAGVIRFEVKPDGSCTAELALHEPEPVKVRYLTEDEDLDPLSDPATFGLRPGQRVPGFSRLHEPGERE